MAAQKDLVAVLPDEVQFNRRYWLLYPEEFRDLARIRRVADFIVDAVRSSGVRFTYG